MTRPARRTSSLGTNHPAAPIELVRAAAPAVMTAAPEQPVRSRDGANRGRSRKAHTSKTAITFYAPAELASRARAAFLRTQGLEANRFWSDFIAAAVERETQRLEDTYNAGQPWDGVGAGQMPTGRPADA